MVETSIYDFMGESYARSRREAHRRRATLLSPPTVSLCACIERPGNWQRTFERFLEALLGQLGDAQIGSHGRAETRRRASVFIRNAVRHYDVSREPEPGATSADLTFQVRDSEFEAGIWRVEVLRDYVAVTLHVGIELDRSETHYQVRMAGREADASSGLSAQPSTLFQCEFLRAGPTNREAATGLNRVLFNDLPTELELRFRRIMEAVKPIYLEPAGTRTQDLEEVVFALTYSVLAPWSVLADADPDPDVRPGLALAEPVFPDFDAPGFRPDELAHAQQTTNRFLTQHWNVLKGTLLSEKESDSVACYMLNGHCLYVSSLGSETLDPKEPVKYLLLYRDPASPPKAPRGVSHATPCNFAWRLSRFVGRVHDIGAARLRAFSQHEEISRFLVHGQDLEFRLAERKLDRDAVKELESRFRMITHARTRDVPAGEGFKDEDYRRQGVAPNAKPIMVRTGIVQSQYAIMRRLCEDLGIIGLPAYQAYDQFLRRRVIGPIEWMLTAPDLYRSIAQKLGDANVRLQRQATVKLTQEIKGQSESIAKFQRSADLLGQLLFVYYGMQTAYYLAVHHGDAPERLPMIGSFMSLVPAVDPNLAALVVGLAIIVLLSVKFACKLIAQFLGWLASK